MAPVMAQCHILPRRLLVSTSLTDALVMISRTRDGSGGRSCELESWFSRQSLRHCLTKLIEYTSLRLSGIIRSVTDSIVQEELLFRPYGGNARSSPPWRRDIVIVRKVLSGDLPGSRSLELARISLQTSYQPSLGVFEIRKAQD
jgi:hypothetical protein